jgi:hypothetical protein
MAKTWEDLTPEERLDHQDRVERALAYSDEAAAALAERQRTGNWHVRPTPIPQTETAPAEAPETPVQRPASSPRDWHAEAAYFCGMANNRTDTKINELVEAIGLALADERAAMRAEYEKNLTERLAAVRSAVEGVITEQIGTMRREFLAAIRQDEEQLEQRLRRLDRLIQTAERSALVATAPIDVRPH